MFDRVLCISAGFPRRGGSVASHLFSVSGHRQLKGLRRKTDEVRVQAGDRRHRQPPGAVGHA